MRSMYCWAVSCIKCPFLLSPNPSAARQTAQFLDRVKNGALRHVARDFDFADLARQHKVHNTVLGLLVGLQAGKNLPRTHINLRQSTQAKNGIRDAPRSYTVSSAYTESYIGRRDHPPGNRLSVQKALVDGLGLEGMTDRMSKVQHPAQTAFAFIG